MTSGRGLSAVTERWRSACAAGLTEHLAGLVSCRNTSGPVGSGQLHQQLDPGWALITATLMGSRSMSTHELTDTETHKHSHSVLPRGPPQVFTNEHH